jgi:hypothetical protein
MGIWIETTQERSQWESKLPAYKILDISARFTKFFPTVPPPPPKKFSIQWSYDLWLMNWKVRGRKLSEPILRYNAGVCMTERESRKTRRITASCWNLNQRSPERSEWGMLTIQLFCVFVTIMPCCNLTITLKQMAQKFPSSYKLPGNSQGVCFSSNASENYKWLRTRSSDLWEKSLSPAGNRSRQASP